MMRKKKIAMMVSASALLGAASMAWAGAYGEAASPEETPAPAPAAVVEEAPAPAPGRLFSGFASEAATARGFYAELDSMYHSYDEFGWEADIVTTQLRLAYGQELFEVGAELPFVYASDSSTGDTQLGNINFYGKVLPIRTETVTAGGGMQISTPSGDSMFNSGDGWNWMTNQVTPAGDDEWGFNPFLTAGTQCGPLALRANIGYQVWTGGGNLYDNVTYNMGAILPVGEIVSLRTEIVGRHYVDGAENDPVSVVPGLDIRLPVEAVDIALRPTGMVGLADAPEWGLGLGVAVSQK